MFVRIQHGSTYITVTAEEVWNELLVDVIHEAPGSLIVLPSVYQELLPRTIIDERTDERPENWENPRGTDDQQTPHGFRVVRLDNLDYPQQPFYARSPQVAHTQSFQIDDAGEVAVKETTSAHQQ